jgi:hypothetical protein
VLVGAITEVVADDLDFAHPSGIAFPRTCAVSRLGIGRFWLGRNSDMSGLDMLRATVGTDALSPVLDCDVAARGHKLRAFGLTVGRLGRDELGLSSW